MPIVDISTTFVSLINTLMAQADNGLLLSNQRVWFVPNEGNWAGDPLDITDRIDAFDRTDINNQYKETLDTAGATTGGRLGDSKCAKIQIDYIAAAERSYNTRYLTLPRAAMLAAGRKVGQCDPAGIFNKVLLHAQDSLAAAYNGGDVGVDPGETV